MENSKPVDELKDVELMHELAEVRQRGEERDVDSGDPLIGDLEQDDEERVEPQVVAELRHQGHERHMSDIQWRLLLLSILRKGSDHHEDGIAADEDAQICDLHHQLERVVLRQPARDE